MAEVQNRGNMNDLKPTRSMDGFVRPARPQARPQHAQPRPQPVSPPQPEPQPQPRPQLQPPQPTPAPDTYKTVPAAAVTPPAAAEAQEKPKRGRLIVKLLKALAVVLILGAAVIGLILIYQS